MSFTLKEVCESFEFFERVRRRVRAPAIADLAAGHGLTGLLFALFERDVQRVVLVDSHPPASHLRILDALCEVAPWVRPKVRWVTDSPPTSTARTGWRQPDTAFGGRAFPTSSPP